MRYSVNRALNVSNSGGNTSAGAISSHGEKMRWKRKWEEERLGKSYWGVPQPATLVHLRIYAENIPNARAYLQLSSL